MKLCYLVAMVFLAIANFAHASTWEKLDVPLSVKSKNGTAIMAVEKDSIIRNGNTATAWFRLSWSEGASKTIQFNNAYNCKTRTVTTTDNFFLEADGSRS